MLSICLEYDTGSFLDGGRMGLKVKMSTKQIINIVHGDFIKKDLYFVSFIKIPLSLKIIYVIVK